MLDIRSDLEVRKSKRISLHELIEQILVQSSGAVTYSEIAEWLLINLSGDKNPPQFGVFTIGGGISTNYNNWGDGSRALNDMLTLLYRNDSYPLDPEEIPF